ncbi:hypothetical protein, partial [uncultured Streptococcus sp.]|uniref:hypothetical protein n=1 Tax=uncultured Streptococcus sp. TaxID=83427 RepID=UPI003211A14F
TFATFVSTSLYTLERPKVKSTVYYCIKIFPWLSRYFSFLFLILALLYHLILNENQRANQEASSRLLKALL